jgi:hypothetical protein
VNYKEGFEYIYLFHGEELEKLMAVYLVKKLPAIYET